AAPTMAYNCISSGESSEDYEAQCDIFWLYGEFAYWACFGLVGVSYFGIREVRRILFEYERLASAFFSVVAKYFIIGALKFVCMRKIRIHIY
ncbi:hypothetical protein GCQ90_04410, partial [Salmonella enterica]|nr:hypothetical protein [Salmonella enterica]